MTNTTDFSKFGSRERQMAEQLLHAWNTAGLPEDFDEDEVRIMMNTNSGDVFLTNSNYDFAMMNGDKLESFYHTTYNGYEGFLEDLLPLLDDEYVETEDKEYIQDLINARKK